MAKIKIVIDAGHGGKDKANRGRNGYIEANGVLTTSKYLAYELNATGQFEAILTRDIDRTLSLSKRVSIAKDFKPDMMISEHTNAANGRARGVETFYSVDLLKDKTLAYNMSKAISKVMGNPNRGAKVRESRVNPREDYYYIIDRPQDAGIKHVLLIESGFHDNALDEAFLKNKGNLKKIALAQAQVICNFYKVEHKETSNDLHKIMKKLDLLKKTIDEIEELIWQAKIERSNNYE